MPNQELTEFAEWGETTRDDVLKLDVIREIIYTESGSLSVGQNLVGTRNLNSLSVEFAYPGEMTAEYPVAQDSLVDRQKIGWNDFSMRLKKGQARYFISDSAKLEGVAGLQQNMTRQRTSEALARRKDENILGTLKDGAFSENHETKSSGEEWNASGGPDLVDELWSMWKDILVNAPLNNMNVRDFAVVLPVEVWANMNQLELINNVQQRVRDYLGQTFGFSIYPTKLGMHEDDKVDLQDTAIMLIPGDETAVHGILDAGTAASKGVPLVENERKYGQGEDYTISQWYNTGVLEHETGSNGESPRIAVRENINANV